MKKERLGILIIISIFLMGFVYADRLMMSPITGHDVVSGVNQPGASIVEGNNANNQNPISPPLANTLQGFISNYGLYFLIGLIVLAIIIVLVMIILRKQKKEAMQQ